MKALAEQVALKSLAIAAVFLFATGTVSAGELPAPQGSVLLSVDGKIANTTDGSTAKFDRAQLEAFGLHKLTTSNPFIEGVHDFEGVRLADVLNAVQPQGTALIAHALDGYNVDIPLEDASKYNVLLAMKMDGKVMRVRSKGPLWIIYPVDQHDELKAEHFSSRSIWQLTTLTVK